MTGQPNATPQDIDPELTGSLLDVKPRKKTGFSLPFGRKDTRTDKLTSEKPSVEKLNIEKSSVEKASAVRVPLNKPGGKRLPKEPGQAARVAKPGLTLATSAQQKKMLPLLGVFLLLGAVSLYVNFGNASTQKPITAFVGPGPGQPGYIPAPGTMTTSPTGNSAAGVGTGMTTSPSAPGSASAGFMPSGTAASGTPVVTSSAPPSGTPVVSSSAPPSVTGTAGSTTAPGTAQPSTPGSTPTAAQGTKPGSTKPGTGTADLGAGKTATVPGAPGTKAAAATDIATEPVIPDVFSAADGKGNSGTSGSSSNTNGTAGGGTVQGTQGVSVTSQSTLRNVPLAAVPRQVQVAPAAPLSIQSLPAPAAPPPVPQVRSVPTLAAIPVPLPRTVMAQVIPPAATSLPLAAPITVRTPSGVTLTRGAPATTPAAAPSAPSVVLVGTASGDTPTAILATHDGQMIAGIGDHVTVNDLDYTVSTIATNKVTLTHLKDTLTLTETN